LGCYFIVCLVDYVARVYAVIEAFIYVFCFDYEWCLSIADDERSEVDWWW
jgi:hypothetical protein